MALFFECMPSCARKVLDTADIVRDGDFAPIHDVISVLEADFDASPCPDLH
jgi:hypothetical protein